MNTYSRIISIALIMLLSFACEVKITKDPPHALTKGAGQSVTFTWDATEVEDAVKFQLVQLDSSYKWNVSATGSKKFTPSDSTQYELRVTKSNGEVVVTPMFVHVLAANGVIDIKSIDLEDNRYKYMDNPYFDYTFQQSYGTMFQQINVSAVDIDLPDYYLVGGDINDMSQVVNNTYSGTAYSLQWPLKAGNKELGFVYCDPFSDPFLEGCIEREAKGVTKTHKLWADVYKVFYYNTCDQYNNCTDISKLTMMETVGLPLAEHNRQSSDIDGPYGNVDEIFSSCSKSRSNGGYGGKSVQYVFENHGIASLGPCAKPVINNPNGTGFNTANPGECELAMGALKHYEQYIAHEIRPDGKYDAYETTHMEAFGLMLSSLVVGMTEEEGWTELSTEALHIFFLDSPYFGEYVDAYYLEFFPFFLIDYVNFEIPQTTTNIMVINANAVDKRPQYLDKMIAQALTLSSGALYDPDHCTKGNRWDSILCKGFGHKIQEYDCEDIGDIGLSGAHYKLKDIPDETPSEITFLELDDLNH